MTKNEIINYLWELLDGIDTADDIAGDSDKVFREMVNSIQKERWKTGITTDGYSLDIPEE